MSTENMSVKTNEQIFEDMMGEKLKNNFSEAANQRKKSKDARLEEMNKKLPEWSLEPPYSFLQK